MQRRKSACRHTEPAPCFPRHLLAQYAVITESNLSMASFRPFRDTLAGKTFHSWKPWFFTSIKKLFHRYFFDFRPKIARASIFFHHATPRVKQSRVKRASCNLAGTHNAAPPPKNMAYARRYGGKQPCLGHNALFGFFLEFRNIGTRHARTVRFHPARRSCTSANGGGMPFRALAHDQPG